MTLPARREGWEARLAAVIEWARSRPYELGVHDCFKFTCRGVEALVGVDLWKPWESRYRTRRDALRCIAEVAPSFDLCFTKMFGVEPRGAAWARRGDVLKYIQNGEAHLGLCNGETVAGLGEHGLLFIPTLQCDAAWRIG